MSQDSAREQVTITLPDGTSREYASGSTPADIAASIGKRLAKATVAAKVDGEWVDATVPLAADAKVELVTADSDEGREVLRHSTAHVLAEAVTQLFPGAKYAIGPAIADGFYYDFELPDGAHFSEHDLERITQRMRELIKADQRFERDEVDYDTGLAVFADQPYKREIIAKVRAGEADADDAAEVGGAGGVSLYRNIAADGEVAFVDLCRGPHVPSTGRLGAFKLTKVAGAYWRGDEHRPMLQRIYGSAWESEAALAEHLHRLEEAERRDHRRLGAELDLFSFPDEIGSGLAVFHPKGGMIRKLMEDYSRERHVAGDYQFVNSPHITKSELFETSGHLQWFADGMFPPMELDGGTQYYLKPMNCPFHVLIYRSQTRSYRDLPLRLFEFGGVYRYEKSGVVHGLTRVRGMTQDDAHIFVTPEQMTEELQSTLVFVLDLLRDFGLNDFYLELSTKPEGKAAGTDEEWDAATEALRAAAEPMNLELVLDEGGGAFYGPKISVQARDAIGRTWQISTIQLDFQTPKRF
ncbi:MAG: threonyl-tRNA synthetase, partial [Actinomycetota bacterium]|nr:threonyl-tRNA synthetase [Actinomycetota bacterium]